MRQAILQYPTFELSYHWLVSEKSPYWGRSDFDHEHLLQDCEPPHVISSFKPRMMPAPTPLP